MYQRPGNLKRERAKIKLMQVNLRQKCLERTRDLREKGFSIRKIAGFLGVGKNTVASWIKEIRKLER